ncbi:MAG: iron-containing alcohol dehydrogenase [candidate division WOR-3 bacterium]|nr:MAG: iron-containing alcohol dehydrogenase [candidate division WOR-3 bacterium]
MRDETLPRFVELGAGIVNDLAALFAKFQTMPRVALLLCDENTAGVGGHHITETLRKDAVEVFECRVDNSDSDNVQRVRREIECTVPDLVIGFGGGKVLDVAKLSAADSNTRFISVPTTLSNDGIASPVSVIKDVHNIPISHITRPPFGVIIDITIVRTAPRRHLIAGVGDLISNLSAVFDARLARAESAESKEAIDSYALQLAEAGGKRVLKLDDNDITSSRFLEELAHGLIKSGFAMCISGTSRPASGSEHKISHSIDHLYPPNKGLHGEQVGIATLFTMALQKNELLKPVRKFYESIGFPCRIGYLNLKPDEFVQVVFNASRIRPERYTILEDKRPDERKIREIIEFSGL